MIFVDAGPLIARVYPRDSRHKNALEVWDILKSYRCITTNLVIVETVNFLSGKIGGRSAVKWGRSLYYDPWVKVVESRIDDEIEALPLVERLGKGIGLADAVSFLIMRRYGIKEVATFDSHFKIAGFVNICEL